MRTPRASSIPAPVDTDGLLRRIVSAVGRKIDDFAHHTPSRFAVIIFTSIILLWTTIYMLPISSADGTVTPFHEALFTAVSTICVTGLSVVDMATHWSGFGHFMVFLGMQVGAIGVLTLASIMGAIVTRRLGLRQKLVAASDKTLDAEMKAKLNKTLDAMHAMEKRGQTVEAYDQMIAEGNKDGNAVVQTAIDGLLDQTKTIERVSAALDLGKIQREGSESLDSPNAVFK